MRHIRARLRTASISVVALVAFLAALSVSPLAAAASASTPTTVTLADAYNLGSSASAADVSCATTTCGAVGTVATSGATTVPFVSVATGSTWVSTVVPVTAGTGVAVQCVSDSFCVATGTSMTNAVESAWVGTWNGQLWQFSPLATDLSAMSISAVSSLSCATSSQCAIGGTYVDANGLYQGFVSLFNGSSWASTPIATSLNFGGDGEVLGVSCANDGSCTAVGYVTSGSFSYQGIAAQYFNGAWSTSLVGTDIAMMASSIATSVSCWSSSACEVGGNVVDGSGSQQALVGSWNGTSWTDQTLGSSLNVDGNATVTALACAADTSCAAVGNFLDGNGQEQAFAANLSAGQWEAGQIAEGIGAASASAQAVTCLSQDQCVATGYDIDQSGATQAFTSLFDGVAWTDSALFATQNAGGNATATAASCSASQCVLAGSFAGSSTSSHAAFERPVALGFLGPLLQPRPHPRHP